MSKARALELCDEADQELGYYNIELLEVVKSLAKAVRELAEDQPEDPRYKEAFENCCQVRDYLTKRVIQLEGYLNELNLPPPKSDPPSPT